MKPIAEKLSRYFATAEATAGHRGTFREGFVSGGSDYDRGMVNRVEHKGRWISEHVRIRRGLAKLTAHERDILWLAFGPTQWPPQLAKAFGKFVGCTLVGKLALTANPLDPGAFLRSIVARNDRPAIRAVVDEANQSVQFALDTFEKTLNPPAVAPAPKKAS